MNKTLVLVRHAHRVKLDGGRADNGLSPKGRKQAAGLARYFTREFKDSAVLIVSSPKKRCVETVAPLTHGRQATTALVGELDEGGNLSAKSRRFARWWRAKGPLLTVVCSHADVLPVLIRELTGGRVHMSKGACAIVELEGKELELTSLIQDP